MARLFDSNVNDTFRKRDVKMGYIEQIAMDAPVFSMLPKPKKPRSPTPEWGIKTYDTPKTAGVPDTDVTSADYENNQANKSMLKSRYHKLRRVPAVGDVEEEVGQQEGRPETSTFADNVKDKLKEAYVDAEVLILGDNEAQAASTDVTPSETRAMCRWLSNDNARFTDVPTTPAAAYRTPTSSILTGKATADAITEQEVLGLILSIAETRKRDATGLLAIATPLMRAAFAEYTRIDPNGVSATALPIRRFNQNKDTHTIDHQVTKFMSDVGYMDIMTSYHLTQAAAGGDLNHLLIIEKDGWEIGVARAPRVRRLEDRGAGPLAIIDQIFVLMCLNPQAHAIASARATA